MKNSTITLTNSITELAKMQQFISSLSDKLNLSQSNRNSISLALEEAFVNVIEYAYPKESVNTIKLTADYSKDKIIFTLVDSGIPFDPTVIPDVDTSLPLEERAIGGLGIFLIRNIMDSVTYLRDNNTNILTLTYTIK